MNDSLFESDVLSPPARLEPVAPDEAKPPEPVENFILWHVFFTKVVIEAPMTWSEAARRNRDLRASQCRMYWRRPGTQKTRTYTI